MKFLSVSRVLPEINFDLVFKYRDFLFYFLKRIRFLDFEFDI